MKLTRCDETLIMLLPAIGIGRREIIFGWLWWHFRVAW